MLRAYSTVPERIVHDGLCALAASFLTQAAGLPSLNLIIWFSDKTNLTTNYKKVTNEYLPSHGNLFTQLKIKSKCGITSACL